MSERPILSIVIPTRNRHSYLAALIRSLLNMASRDFEVIVHDNSDENGEYVRLCGSISDSRLRYYFEPTFMAITENCDRAVSLATGSFVCMIGDDDGVVESVIDLARWMESSGVDAAAPVVPTYLWPGVSSVLDGGQTQGILRLPRYSGRVEFIAESVALDAVFQSGGSRIGDLPSVYHGVVSKRALDALKLSAGTYFPGPSPDMANAVGLSAVIDRFARVDMPIVISGVCPDSGAAEGARHSHQGEIADKEFLAADTALLWPAQVPFYFSGPTLWATSLVRALVATGRKSLLPKIRYDRLYAACVVFAPLYRSRVDEIRARNPGLVLSPALGLSICWVWWQRAKALMGNLARKVDGTIRGNGSVVGLVDIGEVVRYLTDRFNGHLFERISRL